VDSQEEPKPAPLSPIGFTGLRAEVRVNKAGGFVEMWSADSVLEPTRSANAPKPAEKAA
jgi:hypothetical protein